MLNPAVIHHGLSMVSAINSIDCVVLLSCFWSVKILTKKIIEGNAVFLKNPGLLRSCWLKSWSHKRICILLPITGSSATRPYLATFSIIFWYKNVCSIAGGIERNTTEYNHRIVNTTMQEMTGIIRFTDWMLCQASLCYLFYLDHWYIGYIYTTTNVWWKFPRCVRNALHICIDISLPVYLC